MRNMYIANLVNNLKHDWVYAIVFIWENRKNGRRIVQRGKNGTSSGTEADWNPGHNKHWTACSFDPNK